MRRNLDEKESTILPEMHRISKKGMKLLIDPDSITILKVTDKVFDIINDISTGDSLYTIANRYNLSTSDVLKLGEQIKKAFKDGKSSVTVYTPDSHVKINKLNLIISNSCNLRCKYCYATGGIYIREPKFMSKQIALKAVDLAMETEALEQIVFIGGEPLLNIKIIKAVSEHLENLAKKNKISYIPKMGIITNMTVLTDEAMKVIKKFNIDVNMSTDGPCAINDLNRIFPNGEGTFEVIGRNFERLKESTNGKQPNNISAVFTKEHSHMRLSFLDVLEYLKNKYGIIPLIKLASPLKRDGLNVTPDYSGNIKNFEELAEYTISTWESAKPQRLHFDFGSEEALIKKVNLFPSLCHAGVSIIAIDPRGNIYPCHALTSEDLRMGNVFDKDIFFTKSFLEMRNKFVSNTKHNNKKCKKCWIRAFCLGCYVHAYNHNGKLFDMPDSICNAKCNIAESLISNLTKVRKNPDQWRNIVNNLKKCNSL